MERMNLQKLNAMKVMEACQLKISNGCAALETEIGHGEMLDIIPKVNQGRDGAGGGRGQPGHQPMSKEG
jgi:hypothetical protein